MRLIQYDANGKILYCGTHPNLPEPCVVCVPEYVENIVVQVGDPIDFRALWHELHTKVRTAEQFANWVTRVPSFGCSCSQWLKDYLAKNPLQDDLRRYGWELHCAVNRKLNKQEFTWAEFETKYVINTS